MIDYIKLDVSYLDRSKISKNEHLNFVDTYRRYDGAGIKSKADFSNLTFTVVPTRIFIEGSLHKYYNSRNELGDQNHNKFTYDHILWAINDLKALFGIIPEKSKILNIEYGVNLEIDEDPSELLQAKVIFYKTEYPNSRDYNANGFLLEFNFDEYKLKMYDKGAQYNVEQNLLRFEIRTKKSRFVGSKLGIHYLADLCELNNLIKLHNDLKGKMNDVYIYDRPEPIAVMSELENYLYTRSQTKSFFRSMDGPSKYNKATKARAQIRRMLSKYNLNTTHLSMLKNLELKRCELLPIAC